LEYVRRTAGLSKIYHLLIVALTHHPRGDEYLEDFATAIDDLLQNAVTTESSNIVTPDLRAGGLGGCSDY
jgi:hypothetical protein